MGPGVTDVHPALVAAAGAAREAFTAARARHGRSDLAEVVATGADGTPATRLDLVVEDAVVDALGPFGVNVLSEEIGLVDRGSAVTVVIDPVDGTGNATAGVPLAAFTAAVVLDGVPVEGLTDWFDTGRRWWARAGRPGPCRTSGATCLEGALVSTIRPKGEARAWWALVQRCDRVRILGSSSLEAALVADGALDAFADVGSDTHRIVDLVAAMVIVPAAGGVVVDAHGRELRVDGDVTGRFSGVVAATPTLADEIVALVSDASVP